MEPWHFAAVTVLASAYLIVYFATYKPPRLATIALAFMLSAIMVDSVAVIAHHFTRQAPSSISFILAARLFVCLAVLVLLAITLRHQQQ